MRIFLASILLMGCVQGPRPLVSYKLSNGKVVHCEHIYYGKGAASMSRCVGGSEYENQTNYEVLPK